MTWELLGIFSASVLGSWHCAGMCGPFGVLLRKSPSPQMAQMGYHLGRLVSYSGLALLLQVLSVPFRMFLGKWIFVLILVGWAILFFRESRWLQLHPPGWMRTITRRLTTDGGAWAAAGLGVGTGLIPCAWLYGFLIVAGSQDHWVYSLIVTSVFWLGTLPGLGASIWLLNRLGGRIGPQARKVSVLLVILPALFSWWTHQSLFKTDAGHSCEIHDHKP